jgi:transcription elongation GreA/GreB family factor
MNQTTIDKSTLVTLIIAELTQELNQAINAANEAHADAVDDESVAETQYDTLAIEASYLAEGQSRRVLELQSSIQAYQQLNLLNFDENVTITFSALVQLCADSSKNHWFFIGPAAGGFRCILSEQSITVITAKSPMGLALMDKMVDDDIEIMLGSNELKDYIANVQ